MLQANANVWIDGNDIHDLLEQSLPGHVWVLRQFVRTGFGSLAQFAMRSNTLLKVKNFLDAEAVVIGHEPGKGKHKGRLGALSARLANGKVFSVGTGFKDRERANPPAIGSTILFRYQELSEAGIPRFPSYVGPKDLG